ncbi:hypothetical protein L1987_23550 [Smallanthus sonchifolius]|uniref:Uncharacterized protein n=1 Tax=Smallanthus sonchifolius TaxID=185202 RepID=A0ACB9II82_9ASTR|nr:hypothetical protein L1987_23550 [Smallanthus sonchifolius]
MSIATSALAEAYVMRKHYQENMKKTMFNAQGATKESVLNSDDDRVPSTIGCFKASGFVARNIVVVKYCGHDHAMADMPVPTRFYRVSLRLLDNSQLSTKPEACIAVQNEAWGVPLNRHTINSTANLYYPNHIPISTNLRNKSATGAVILCFSIQGPVEIEDAEVAVWVANATGLIFVIPTIRIDMIQGTKHNNYLSQSM